MNQAAFEKPWGNYLLDKIVETPAPEQVSFLPQTIGWQILACLFVLFMVKKSLQAYQQYQANAYRREALTILNQLTKSPKESGQQQLPVLLRKVAIQGFNRTQVTQLTGKDWDIWLDKHCDKTSFVQQCPNLLHNLTFLPTCNLIDENERIILIEQIRLWIKFHRRQND